MRIPIKSLSILGLAAILTLIISIATPVNAQTITKPSVPEFTVKYVDASYDIPPTTTANPYTGQNTTTPSRHIQNRTVQVTIKNQPFTTTQTDNGQTITLYLNIRFKGAYAQNWTNIYSPDLGFLTQTSGEYTQVAYSIDDNEFPFWDNLQQGGTVEFQVEALNGSVYRQVGSELFAPWVFQGEESGWSNTQTVIIAGEQTNPSPTPTVPEFPAIAMLPFIAAASFAVILFRKKSQFKQL